MRKSLKDDLMAPLSQERMEVGGFFKTTEACALISLFLPNKEDNSWNRKCKFRSLETKLMQTDSSYKIPADTRIGHVHLKVADLQRALDFYCGLLGFELTATYGTDAAFISAGGYHHHIGLNTWLSKNAPPAPPHSTGLFHTAILFPTRKDLAASFQRLREARYPLTGASDHGVSEALYLDDPDKNGVELYWDRPRHQWPAKPDGSLEIFTRPLDLAGLLKELEE